MNGSFTAWLPAAMIAFWNLHDLLLAGLVLAGARRELDFQVMRIEEAADAAHDFDLARLRHAGQAAGQLLDHAVLEAAQLGRGRSAARRS